MTITVIGNNTGDDFSGTNDCHLLESSPTTTFNYLSNVVDGRDTVRSVILQQLTGLSSIAASEVVSSVTLGLFRETSNTPSVSIYLHRLLKTWGEGTATWNTTDGSTSWTTAGALSDGNDRSATASVALVMGNASIYYTVTDTGTFMSDVQNFINSGYPNYGHGLYITDTNAVRAVTSNTGTDGQRPYVAVTHAAGGAASLLPRRSPMNTFLKM